MGVKVSRYWVCCEEGEQVWVFVVRRVSKCGCVL